MEKSPSELSTAELEALLAKKKSEEKKALEAKKKEYELERDRLIENLSKQADDLSSALRSFKQAAVFDLTDHQEKLQEYGKLRKNSLGGFSLTHSNGLLKVTYRYRTLGRWDERASKAEALLKEFLADTVKKRDKDTYEIIMSLLAKNLKGQLEYSRVQVLYKHEARFSDPRWVEAIRLLKESYVNSDSRYDIYFEEKDTQGRWKNIELSFPSMPVIIQEKEETAKPA